MSAATHDSSKERKEKFLWIKDPKCGKKRTLARAFFQHFRTGCRCFTLLLILLGNDIGLKKAYKMGDKNGDFLKINVSVEIKCESVYIKQFFDTNIT